MHSERGLKSGHCIAVFAHWVILHRSGITDILSAGYSVMVMCASVFISEDNNNIVLLRKICNLMQKNINKYEHRCRLYYYVHAVSSL